MRAILTSQGTWEKYRRGMTHRATLAWFRARCIETVIACVSSSEGEYYIKVRFAVKSYLRSYVSELRDMSACYVANNPQAAKEIAEAIVEVHSLSVYLRENLTIINKAFNEEMQRTMYDREQAKGRIDELRDEFQEVLYDYAMPTIRFAELGGNPVQLLKALKDLDAETNDMHRVLIRLVGQTVPPPPLFRSRRGTSSSSSSSSSATTTSATPRAPAQLAVS